MFVNLNLFKIGQNKWVCGTNQMVCLEKFILEAFEPGITKSALFRTPLVLSQPTQGAKILATSLPGRFQPLTPLKFKLEPLCHNESSGKDLSGLRV